MSRRVFWNVARILVGIALVILVLQKIHFRDSLVFRDGSSVSGQILGESADSVTFRPAGSTEIQAIQRSRLEGAGVIRGVRTLVRSLSLGPFLLSLAALGAGWLVTVIRWQILTRARGIPIPFWEALRLTFVGFFFSNVIPGATGGDIVKAYLAAKGRAQKTDMAVSVFVDRIIGLVAMAIVAGVAILFHLGDARFQKLAVAVSWLLGLSLVGALVFFSRRVRRLLRLDWLLERLPAQALLQEIDRAFFHYRYQKRAVVTAFALSLANLSLLIANNSLIGASLRAGVNGWSYLIFAPVANIVTAIPLLPGGWGLGEWAYGYLFRMVGASTTLGVTLSILYRTSTVAWSLLGGVFFVAAKSAGWRASK